MAWDVYLSPMADRQVQGLRRRRKKAYEDFLDDLEQRGCAALDYRLTGPAPLDSICIKHLWGQDRAVVTFRASDEAWIMLVAPHNDQDPEMDVYQALYRLAGQATPTGKRTKPSCCDTGGQAPDLDEQAISDLVSRARHLARQRRSSR